MILSTSLPFHSSGIVEGIIAGIILLVGGKAWKGLLSLKATVSTARKRARIQSLQKRLKELDEAEYLPKTQRNMFRYLGMSIYALGAYLLFSQYLPTVTMTIIKFAGAAFVMVLGGLATYNAATMNAYGIERVRSRLIKDIEKLEASDEDKS